MEGAGESRQCQPGPSTSSSSSSNRQSDQSEKRAPMSLVEYCGAGISHCGYCKGEGSISEGRRSYDMRTFRLVPEDYQELLDRGWRRSGSYCYHPINMATCCPNYPIQCKATEFKLSRSKRRCIKNLNSYLVNGSDSNKKITVDYLGHNRSDKRQSPSSTLNIEQLKKSSKARARRFLKSCEKKASVLQISLDAAFNLIREEHIKRKRQLDNLELEDYLYPMKEPREKSKNDEVQAFQAKHSLEINMYQTDSGTCKALREDEHKMLRRYQNVVHKEKLTDWTMSRFRDFLVMSPLYVQPMKGFDHTTFCDSDIESASIPLYSDSNTSQYLLVKPPGLPTCYGTYHCVYHLDGKLIAVGVLDILPKCVTTVYFFYEPSYGHLNLGIYSALVEISIVRQLNKHAIDLNRRNELINYHMGFYVHECLKMRYKTTFRPSYLLCSETCRYLPTDICLSKLVGGRKYARFSTEPEDAGFSIYVADIDPMRIVEIPIGTFVVESSLMSDYIKWATTNLDPEQQRNLIHNYLMQYMRLVGPNLAPKMRLILK